MEVDPTPGRRVDIIMFKPIVASFVVHIREKDYLCKMKPSQKKKLFNVVGKYCLDLSKLVFGGVILAGIMELEFDKVNLIIIGTSAVAFLIFGGFVCLYLASDFGSKKTK